MWQASQKAISSSLATGKASGGRAHSYGISMLLLLQLPRQEWHGMLHGPASGANPWNARKQRPWPLERLSTQYFVALHFNLASPPPTQL